MDLTPLFEKAKESKKAINSLKIAAISAGCFELAAKLRDFERDTFPESDDEKYAKTINMSLRMVGVNPDLKTCWIIGKTMHILSKKKGRFNLEIAADIQADADKIFDV